MKKTFFYTMLLIVLIFGFSQNVLALGQMTEPIIITNALRENEYQEMLVVVNTEDTSANISFSTEGEIEGWAKFYLPNDLENPIEDVEVGAKQNKDIVAIFTVPVDMPNGEYIGLVSAIKKPGEMSAEEGSFTNVAQKIDREVTINVGGEEDINFAVSVIPESFDINKNTPLKIRFIYDNQGNVSLKPQIDLKIKNNNSGEVVYNAIYPYPESEPAVRPNVQYEIPALQISTSGWEIGKYLTEIKFLHNNNVITEESFRFSIREGGLLGMVKGISIGKWQINWWMILVAVVIIVGIIVVSIVGKKHANSDANKVKHANSDANKVKHANSDANKSE